MTLFDTHTHLFDERFSEDLPQVLERAAAAGVTGIVCVGIDAGSSQAAVELASRYPGVYAAAGLQPNYLNGVTERDWEAVAALATQPQVVAIGETGLDRYWPDVPFPLQEEYFCRHIELSRRLGKPLVIHCRDAEADVLRHLRAAFERGGPLRGVMHAFTGSAAAAAECLRMGLYISFAGMVSYPKAVALRETARTVPADRLLIETDSPYLPPQPVRGRRNEPAYVRHVAASLAAARGEPLESLAAATTRNAQTLFGITSGCDGAGTSPSS